jgi:hypothetical protein
VVQNEPEPDIQIVPEPVGPNVMAVLAASESTASQSLPADPSFAPAQPAIAALASREPAAPVLPATTEPVSEPAASLPAAVDAVTQSPKDPPSDDNRSGSLLIEAARAVGPAPQTSAQPAVSVEVRVVLPQRRPASADAKEPAKPARKRQHARPRKAKAQQSARPPTFLDLLFGPPLNEKPKKPTVQQQSRPATPAQTTPPDVTALRSFGVVSN